MHSCLVMTCGCCAFSFYACLFVFVFVLLTCLVLHQADVPKELGQLSALTELVLHSNYISSLPAQFSQLTNLQLLDVSNW